MKQVLKVLICIMPIGRGKEVREALRREAGVLNIFTHHARGLGTQNLRRRVYSDEKQIVTVLVDAERADEIFEFLYVSAGLDAPRTGMVMMGHTIRGVGVVPLPEGESDGK